VLNAQVEQNVTIIALAKIQHFCISNERTTAFSVSVGRLPKQLSNSRTLPSSGTRNGKIRREVESQLEALELSNLLNV
jgi:polysaccharide pyruvyl transferase WcaK-like protein